MKSDQFEHITILHSKLNPPHPTETAIQRGRLLSLMDQAMGKRLIAMVAGAGYGKTTLAAHAVSSSDRRTLWYRLDESDGDLVTFLSYLVAGFRKHYPEFGRTTLPAMKMTNHLSLHPKRTLTAFVSETESSVGEDFLIVLDDFHTVQESQDIHDALQLFLRDLPPHIHFILISRAEPTVPLSRLRAMGEVLDIGEEDLAFQPVETEQLCAEMFALSVAQPSIEAICRKMDGWVAGLILMCHAWRRKSLPVIDQKLEDLKGSNRAIFGYLEENIYRTLTPEIQQFLVRSSILPCLEATFCDQFLNMSRSAVILRHLEENHMFTSSIDREGRWYSYHQLFRDFLRDRLRKELDPEAIAHLQREAAKLLEERGEHDEAVGQYLAAGSFEPACRLLQHVGRRLFRERRFRHLSSYLEAIPVNLLDRQPWAHYLLAQLAGLGGKHQKALEHFRRALGGFFDAQDEEGQQRCLIEMGLIQFQTGSLTTAEECFQKLLERNRLEPRTKIEVLGYLMYISAYRSMMCHADRYFDQALALLNDLDDEDLRRHGFLWIYIYRGYRYLFSGDFAGVLEIAAHIKRLCLDPESLSYPVGACLLVSMACYFQQRYAEGYRVAREGLEFLKASQPDGDMAGSCWHLPRTSLREERGFPDTVIPWLLAYSAMNAAALGKLTEALDDADASLRYFKKMNFRHGEGFACSVLHRVHLKSGRPLAAEQCARSGLELITGLTWVRLEATLKMNLAESLIMKGDLETALNLVAEADREVKSIWTGFLEARLRQACNQHGSGLQRMLPALESLKQRFLDGEQIFQKPSLILPLVKALGQDLMSSLFKRTATGMEPEGAARLARLRACGGNPLIRETAAHLLGLLPRASAASLEIRLLGRFRVFLDGKEIPVERWKSRKARTLFQFLVCSRPRGYLNKEVLMELLWPEEDPALTAKRFHVALASLRKTLEPGLLRGVSSAYLSRMGDAYRIDLGKEGRVDVEDFADELRRAAKDQDQVLSHLLRAESLYGGDFLQEEPYSEWCRELREKYRKDYLELTRRIAAHYEQQGDFAACMTYAEKHLEIDKYAEDIYRSLMRCHWQRGDKLSMARTFTTCRRHLAMELNCALSGETERLYRQLASTP